MAKKKGTTRIYSDGACIDNPGKGGYGVVILEGDTRKEIMGGFIFTSNNRMEIFAAIVGLETLSSPSTVYLYSDSKYLVDSMVKGLPENWKANNWWRDRRSKAANIDLWERLLAVCKIHEVEFLWVKGHSGDKENERADELSILAIDESNLIVDLGYSESGNKSLLVKINQEGQLCRKCSTPVVRKTPKRKRRSGQEYYYEYYLNCPGCGTNYMVEQAKRYIDK